ncbi:MAG: trypsin-like serine protease [Deltaproteobacteria bacterium]|nr:trypsin-like serine protease [Deltaproteobacteria bacterium]
MSRSPLRVPFHSSVGRFCALLVLFAAALPSCGGPPACPAVPIARQEAIVGGVPDEGHPAVGALLLEDGLCSGTLVSPNVVLTAAHCVVGQVAARFVLGADASGPGPSHGVRETFAHPGYGFRHQDGEVVAWHDIAVAVLDGPAAVEPMPWRTEPLDAAAGEPVTFVGFGRTDPDGHSFGRKYKVRTTISGVWDHGFWNLTHPDDPHNTCSGDSGGPALVERDGREEVAGVVSSGDARCVLTGYSSRVDVDAAFVAEMVARHAVGTGAGTGDPGGAPPDAWEGPDGHDAPDLAPDVAPDSGEDAGGSGDPGPCGTIGFEGCCDGQVLRWCEDGRLYQLDCGAGAPLCGWDEDAGYYDCGTDGGEGPGGGVATCGPS